MQTDDILGQRLRAFRQSRGLSMRDLAARADVSHTAISKIERGIISPSVAILKKLALPLGVGVTTLIDDGRGGDGQVFFARKDFAVARLGLHTIRQVGSNLAGHALQFMEDTYEPGADTGPEMLSHFGEEAGMVLSGALEVTVGDAIRILGPDEAYFFESRIPHRFRNPGERTCVVIAAATPPSL